MVLAVVGAGLGVGAVTPAVGQSSTTETVTITTQTTANQPIGGVTLVARWDGGSSRATTAGNGKAFLDISQTRRVNVTVQHPDYTRNRPYTIEPTAQSEYTVTVYRKASLGVSVTDVDGALDDATVELSQDDYTVVSDQTDADGQFDSGTIAQGQYTLSVVKPGYYETTRQITVAGSPSESVALERGSVTYDVRVVDDHFDPAEPISDVTVTVRDVASAQTGENGFASVAVPVNSDLSVEISKEGYGTNVRSLAVGESGGRLNASISLRPALTLETVNDRVIAGERVAVDVTNAYDEPASGVTVLLDGEPAGETDDAGRATITLEEPGTYELRAQSDGAASNAVEVEAVASADSATATATATESEATPVSGPGFGALGTLSALTLALVAVLVLGRRHQ